MKTKVLTKIIFKSRQLEKDKISILAMFFSQINIIKPQYTSSQI